MNYKVTLINRDLKHGMPPQNVQTFNRISLGWSKYDARWNCQSVTISSADYEKHAADLFRACHLAMRRWEPHFEPVEQQPERVPFLMEPAGDANQPSQEDVPLEKLKFFALCALARKHGIKPDGMEKTAIIEAICAAAQAPA